MLRSLSIACASLLALAAGCAEKKDRWYDESKEGSVQRDSEIAAYMDQGMTEKEATRTVDFKAAWKNTEHQAPPPLEGHDLKRAMERPPDP
jgi:hypothetical protein